MMLLGLVLHAMASYVTVPLGDAWPFKDAHTTRAFELPLFVIHLFRMPAFFAVAGFFAALLYARDGAAAFARNRARRVLLPLAIFWATVGPLVLGGFYFAITHSGMMTGAELLATAPLSRELANPSPMHLWFLWYLVIFYASALVTLRLAGGHGLSDAACARLTTSWWTPPVWSALTALTLWPMQSIAIDASPLLFPDPKPVVAYGVFFLFGWLLYRGRERLEGLTMWWSWRTPAMLVPAVLLPTRIMTAVMIWAFVLAAFGFFLHYARRERPGVRYLADASYWMYIVHLPVVIFTAGLLARLPLHAGVKCAIVTAVTFVVCLWTYHAFVRDTIIGRLLNGRRRAAFAGRSFPSSA